MFPPYVWQFTARALEPTIAIFFYGTILRERCEKDHSLGYELLKRISAVMVKRLQAAHKRMLSVYSHDMSRGALIVNSPLMRREPDLSEYD